MYVAQAKTVKAMTRRRWQRGFTLNELLIVVAMISVLAALAMVGYKRYLRSAQASEAKSVIQGIRGLQEQYKSETLTYLNVSTSLTTFYPMATPNAQKWAWDAPGHPDYLRWRQLNYRTDGPVYFGYAVVAGLPGQAIPQPQGFTTLPQFSSFNNNEPWFVVNAEADRDDDGQKARAVSWSGSFEVYMENDTE
jgi:type IV pilus assembly protein PilA